MLWTLIRRTEWRPFLDLLSPSFFKVVPGGPLLAELGRLASLYRSSDHFERAIAARRASLEDAGLPIRLAANEPSASGRDAPPDPQRRGQLLLELYFHQIFRDDFTLLDLRHARFTQGDGDVLVWSPSTVLADFRPEFRRGVRALYRGFYGGDDDLFREGLAVLGLGKAEAELRSQFGEGQQRAVRFSLADFQKKFQDVFVRCQETGSRIDTGFLPLGLYLATLYEHLETLGAAFDARAAFDAVIKDIK